MMLLIAASMITNVHSATDPGSINAKTICRGKRVTGDDVADQFQETYLGLWNKRLDIKKEIQRFPEIGRVPYLRHLRKMVTEEYLFEFAALLKNLNADQTKGLHMGVAQVCFNLLSRKLREQGLLKAHYFDLKHPKTVKKLMKEICFPDALIKDWGEVVKAREQIQNLLEKLNLFLVKCSSKKCSSSSSEPESDSELEEKRDPVHALKEEIEKEILNEEDTASIEEIVSLLTYISETNAKLPIQEPKKLSFEMIDTLVTIMLHPKHSTQFFEKTLDEVTSGDVDMLMLKIFGPPAYDLELYEKPTYSSSDMESTQTLMNWLVRQGFENQEAMERTNRITKKGKLSPGVAIENYLKEEMIKNRVSQWGESYMAESDEL